MCPYIFSGRRVCVGHASHIPSVISMIMSTIVVLGESTVVTGFRIIVTVPISIIIPTTPTTVPASCDVAYILLTSFPRLSNQALSLFAQ